MRRIALLSMALLVLFAGGGATAYAFHHNKIVLKPGHCRTIHKVRVCAKKVKPRTVTSTSTFTATSTVTVTSTFTVTVAPSPIGATFSGNGGKTLDPMTLPHGVTVQWTAQPDSYGYNYFSVSSQVTDTHFVFFNNGDGSTSGTSYIPAGTYTFDVSASAAWTLSF